MRKQKKRRPSSKTSGRSRGKIREVTPISERLAPENRRARPGEFIGHPKQRHQTAGMVLVGVNGCACGGYTLVSGRKGPIVARNKLATGELLSRCRLRRSRNVYGASPNRL